MTVFEYIKWIVIGIMAWMCFSIGLQLYYQTPASISPRVRKFLYKKQHVDKELDKTTSDREYIIPDIYDLISNGITTLYEWFMFPLRYFHNVIINMTNIIMETF